MASLFFYINMQGQTPFRMIVRNATTKNPIVGVSVSVGNQGYVTKDSGIVTINYTSAGNYNFRLTYVGYNDTAVSVMLPFNGLYEILLTPAVNDLEDVTVLATTRNNQRIENSPLKVEVLGKEEMDEENTIKPGSIASILSDVSGIQIQQSSAVSGNANVRIQGLDGRYTQILRDGIPLFDGFSGGFGILTIPPLDLKQIELVKGSASTLYGGGAIGGLINLISKNPTVQQEGSITVNQTSLKESNLNTYAAKKYKKLGYTFFGGLTHQLAVDVNDDGLSDVAKSNAIIVHPRIFYYPNKSTSLALGYTGTFETRTGGDMQAIASNAEGLNRLFFERNKTTRHTTDLIVNHVLRNENKFQIKASVSSFNRNVTTDTHLFKGNQTNYFAEASYLIAHEKYSLVVGVNAVGDRFEKNGGDSILLRNFYNKTVGAFAQLTASFKNNTTVEIGLRGDHHFTYGNFLLPRIALFHRLNEKWALRGGLGLGYKAPNALAQQNVEYNIADIQPLSNQIQAEKSVGYNAEINYKKDFGHHASLFINHAFFLTQINNPVVLTLLANNQVSFNNAGSNIISKGFDTYVQLKLLNWELYAGYTFTIAKRNYLLVNKFMPLTAKNRFAFVLVHQIEDKWRFGLEGSYTGKQFRDNDGTTPGYLFLAALIDRKFGEKFSLVLNCENLLDYRQSRHEALYTGPITNPTFKPLWAPIDGRAINLALKWNWSKTK